MPEPSDPSPSHETLSVDWRTIPLPSDRLTLGQLRKAADGDIKVMDVFMHNLITLEKDAAISAMLAVSESGTSEEKRIAKLLDEPERDDLVALYVEVGLAGGTHEALRLVDELLSTARSRAASSQSRGRS